MTKSGELMEPMGEVCVIDGVKPGVDSRDEGKHTGRNDLSFAEKMM